MKYSSTTRTLNAILFAILGAGFLALAVWLGFFVTPAQIIPNPKVTAQMGPALGLMLASISFALGLISVRGLVYSIISIKKENDDQPVVEAFSSYIGMGFILFIGLILNGVWQIRLTTTNLGYTDMGFLTAAYIVIAIIVLVVSNIPVLKLFDEGEQAAPMLKMFSVTALYAFLGVSVAFGFLTLSTVLGYKDAQHDILNGRFLVLTGIVVLAAIVALVSVLTSKKAVKGEKKTNLPGLLLLVSIALGGAFIIVSGVFENLLEGAKNTTILASFFKHENDQWLDYSIRSYIVGSVVVVASVVAGLVAKFGGKKKKA